MPVQKSLETYWRHLVFTAADEFLLDIKISNLVEIKVAFL